MTLKEAIESGLPFKLPESADWFVLKHGQMHFKNAGSTKNLFVDEAISDRWIVKREPLVFECEWAEPDGRLTPAYEYHWITRAKCDSLMSQLVGKKTRVSVEVIEP